MNDTMEKNVNNEKTTMYDAEKIEDALVSTTLKDVSLSLKEKGYNEINQLVGYIMSGDPGYISSYKDARNKITSIERSTIIEVLVRNYISKI